MQVDAKNSGHNGTGTSPKTSQFFSFLIPVFLRLVRSDPCLATDCKYSNKFHFHCLFGNCKYVCKTSGKAESHCLDHINPNNNLVNIRDQFSYYSQQCLCPNQVSRPRPLLSSPLVLSVKCAIY